MAKIELNLERYANLFNRVANDKFELIFGIKDGEAQYVVVGSKVFYPDIEHFIASCLKVILKFYEYNDNYDETLEECYKNDLLDMKTCLSPILVDVIKTKIGNILQEECLEHLLNIVPMESFKKAFIIGSKNIDSIGIKEILLETDSVFAFIVKD